MPIHMVYLYIPLKRRSEIRIFFFFFAFPFTILWDLCTALDSEPMWMCVHCNVAPFFWFYNCVIQSNITKRLIAQFIFLLLLLLSFVRWHENVSVAIFFAFFFSFFPFRCCVARVLWWWRITMMRTATVGENVRACNNQTEITLSAWKC